MLKPYPLEPPPTLPRSAEPWDGPEVPVVSGRRARLDGDAIRFGGALRLEELAAWNADQDRKLLALEEPIFLWEVTGAGDLRLEGTLVLGAGDLHAERASDGTRIWIGSEGDRAEFLIGIEGGTLELHEGAGGVRLVATGGRALRLIVVGSANESDRDRTLRAFARKRLPGLVAQRKHHLTQIEGLRLHWHSPDPETDAGMGRMAVGLDLGVEEGPDGRRRVAHAFEDGALLLTFGLREQVRDVLRGADDRLEEVGLFAAYAAWVGNDDFLRKQWPRFERIVRERLGGKERSQGAALLLPVAEALGDAGSAAALEGAMAVLGNEAEALVAGVAGPLANSLFLRPMALEGVLRWSGGLPKEWPEMTFERIRVGASTLDLRVRRRPAGIAVKCRLTHGPGVVLELAPRLPFTPSGILVGEHQLPGPSVRFMLDGEEEATWLV